jgi:tRNA (cytosine49-C5)-methyltransferase
MELPSTFIERLTTLYPDKAENILEVFTRPRVTTFRINTLKTDFNQLKSDLKAEGVEADEVPWLPGAFILKSPTLFDLTNHRLYIQGHIYVQSLSSMIPPVVLAPEPTDSVLDIAAAPGSKTTQIAALMNNQGHILANDTSLVRLFKLKANLETQGVTNTRTNRAQGQDLWSRYQDIFDRALVDVPCSMEGRFSTLSPKTYSQWSPKKVKELSMRQRALLRSAITMTRPGGTIVYSTCTLSIEENEAVVDWLIKKLGDQIVIEPIDIPGLPASPAFLNWKHKVFDPQVAHTVRILPSAEMEGFFVAKIKRIY